MKDLVIIGCGGFGREVVEFVKLINEQSPTWNFLGFVDDNENARTVEGYTILGGLEALYSIADTTYACIAIADIGSRKRLAEECEKHGVKFATIISPDLKMRGELCTVGEGSIIATGCEMAINSHVGKHCILNTGAGLGHDTVVGDFVDMMPFTAVMGDVRIGDYCYFGVRSTVINGVRIAEHCTIGACGCVIKDLEEPGTYVGVPVRMVRPYIGMRRLSHEETAGEH